MKRSLVSAGLLVAHETLAADARHLRRNRDQLLLQPETHSSKPRLLRNCLTPARAFLASTRRCCEARVGLVAMRFFCSLV